MINRIIEFSIKNKFIIGLITLAFFLWGIYSLSILPIDAVPDITNNQVQIITIEPTLATQEVEKFISAPIEIAVATIPDVVELRSISRLGLSVVTVVFKDEVNTYLARQQINERLQEINETLHDGSVKPELAPVSTGLGEIFQYAVVAKKGYENKYSAMELRTIQDWIIKRQMSGTPGVDEVNSYGGFVKEYEVAINPDRLKNMNISILELFDALEKNNENTGGAYIDKKPTSYFIRGIGLVNNLEDIEQIVVKINPDGIPILIRDVATVQIGNANRFGAFVVDTIGESVGGVVMMLKGANASKVIKDVKNRLISIEKSLPEGVYIQPFLDRTELVDRTIGTVTDNLLIGGLIVIFILVIFLGNLRAGIVVASVIPLSMLFAISMMNVFGIAGNLMSLGAVDFGLIVDGAVIIVESVVHHLYSSKTDETRILRLSQKQMDDSVSESAKRMMSSAAFGQLIILIVYLPILALIGIEGKMFRPMAQVVGFAILGALIFSLTWVPMFSSVFLSKNTHHKRNISDKIMDKLHAWFQPIIMFSLQRKKLVVIMAVCLFVGSLFIFSRLGGEFIPQLEEGDLAASVITLQGGSLTNTVETVEKANKILMQNFPEIKHVICKIGAAEIPTDPTPMETGDYVIVMKPKSEWTSASTREEISEKMKEKLSAIPGVDFGFQQPIQMRFNELMTGSKQDVAIKIFGDNLDSLTFHGEEIERLIQKIEGIEDIQVEQVTGSPQIQVTYNRNKIAQYGLQICDINQVLRTSFAGSSAGVVFEEEKKFDLVVRLEKKFRQNLDNVKFLSIGLPSGKQIPLEELATVEIKDGTAQVSRENTKRRITVSFNVRNRDIQSVVSEVQTILDKKIKLPAGYYPTIGGEFENLVAAKKRLAIAVPASLLFIFVILFLTFNSLKDCLLIYSAVPLATGGGIIALWLRGMNFSISAGIGFIALFGVAVLNGIVLIAEFNRLEKEEGIIDIYERVLKGLNSRLRPVIITALVASLGFLPMALSTSAGAEVQKPLATVVIGGLISSTLLTLIVLPVLYIIFKQKKRINLSMPPVLLVLIMVLASFVIPQKAIAQNDSIKICNFQQSINQALTNNGLIKVANFDIESQQALKSTAWDFGKTNIEYTYGQLNSLLKDNHFAVNQNFALPLVYVNQNRLAKAKIKSTGIKLTQAQNELFFEVKSTYYSLAYLHAKLILFKHQDVVFQNFINFAKLKYEKGESSVLEKMSAENQWFQIKNQLNQTHGDVKVNRLKLQNLLNEKQLIDISDTILVKLELPVISDSAVINSNPLLSYFQQQIEISQLQLKNEKLQFLPEFSLGYFSQTNKEISGTNRFSGIQAGISIPLMFFSQRGKTKSAAIETFISQTNYEYTQTSLESELSILLQEYSQNKINVAFFETMALPQAEVIGIQAEKSYLSGSINYLEYVQLLKQVIEIKTNYLEALNANNQIIIKIEKMINHIN